MSSADVWDHGVAINLANWERYSASQDEGDACLVAEICAEIQHSGECLITRGYVLQTFSQSFRKGVIASVIWGYPKGRFPGGRSFSGIFSRSEELAITLTGLRRREPMAARDICSQFQGFPGLGPSTYTKMLYFAGIEAVEGPCLIYDQMVMRAIAESDEPSWADIKAELGSCRYPNGRFKMYARGTQEGTYGGYLRAAHGLATAARSAESIELELFMQAPRGRPTQHRQV
ncbi:8-oxoguanine DNA glycosylase OGG fold protein [Porphyrobacter sp. LM 6]|jgi:hypothetical protein|uniref:8-oxoguanine DNA glycosylase OGG fold protein n=1 Tax=Porphyrobacter sp. LM 6 TaxID=1896196 RepID=UPI000863A951|nr:hypothetical protein BG023_111073 [Porphyrobacter sp. LM 6]